MTEMNYEVELLSGSTYKIFKGVYNDFRSKAFDEYKFELEPLDYDEFINAIEKDYFGTLTVEGKYNDDSTSDITSHFFSIFNAKATLGPSPRLFPPGGPRSYPRRTRLRWPRRGPRRSSLTFS